MDARSESGEEPLEPIALHECRPTFASLMIAAGVNAKALSTLMYLMPGAEVEAAELLDSYLRSATEAAHGAS